MKNSKPLSTLIEPIEAIMLFKYATVQEMEIAKELYETYKRYHKTDTMQIVSILEGKHFFDFCKFLSFLYDAGRVQGIREERIRKRNIIN